MREKRGLMRMLYGSIGVVITVIAVGGCQYYSQVKNAIIDEIASTDQSVQNALEELEVNEGYYNEHHIILKNTNTDEAERIAKEVNAEVRTTGDGSYAVLYLNDDTDIRQIYENEDLQKHIEKMEPDYYGTLSGSTSDSGSFVNVTNYLNMRDTWDYTTGSGMQIAVIDTGIDTDNTYLSSKISTKSFNASEGKSVADYDLSVIEEGDKMFNHGTMVASVIAADYDAETGIGGIAPGAELVVIKVASDEDGRIMLSDVVFGVAYAIECDVDVVNMSFAFDVTTDTFGRYINLAADSDIICIASAGNSDTGTDVWPAAYENVIGVGAVRSNSQDSSMGNVDVSVSFGGISEDRTDESYSLADKSNYGNNTDLVAISRMKVTTDNDGQTVFSGTSCSAAMVSAATALYLSMNSHQEFSDIQDVLCASSTDLGIPGEDWYYGYGLLDIYALVVEEKGTITYDYLTDEIDNTTHIFVRNHTLQYAPEPERTYVVFDGWYYDINCVEEYDNFNNILIDDLTVYAAWANEDDTTAYSYYVKDDGTAEITGYLGKRRFITVPSTIDGYQVTSIGARAFYGNSRIRRVILPDTLERICEYAFYNCTKLYSIDIPGKVGFIEQYAFSNCPKLGTVALAGEGGLRTIGDFAFSECSSLNNIELPANLENINATAFFKAGGMTQLTVNPINEKFMSDGTALYKVENGEKSLVYFVSGKGGSYVLEDDTACIEPYAFAYSRLSYITLPDSLSKIGESAFPYAALRSIEIPDAVEVISKNCFYSCSSMKTVLLGSKVKVIEENAFSECGSLTKVTNNAENLVAIGRCAFMNDFSLTAIDFLDGVAEIAYASFYGCSSVKQLTIPASIGGIGEFAFAGCSALEDLVFEDGIDLKILNNWAFNNCKNLKRITLPEGLEEIGDSCFMLTGLEYIYIPASVSQIGYGAFGTCLAMQDIEVAESSEFYCSIDHVLYELEQGSPSILHTYPAGLSGDFSVPDEVEQIADFAFYSAVNLTALNLGNNVKSIGISAFQYCNGLKNICFNDALETIKYGSFRDCANLENAKWNSALRYVGEEAFAGCSSLINVELNEGLQELSGGVFTWCTALESIAFPESLETIGESCFMECTSLKQVLITKNIINIGMNAFYDDYSLTEIQFEAGSKISRLNFGAFANTGITSVIIPASVSSMGQEVFRNCDNLETVTFEANSKLTALSAWTFSNTNNLRKIIFEEDAELEHIEARALEGMKSLEILDISNCTNLSVIDNYALMNCVSISEITIPGQVSDIGRYAFFGCKKLTKLILPDTVNSIGRYAFASIPDITIYFEAAQLPEYLEEYWDYGIKGYYFGTGEEQSNDEWVYSVLADGTISLVRYIGNDTEVVVDTVDGYQVAAVGSNVLSESSTVQSLILPETVLSISNSAFDGALNLNSIYIPSSVTRIGSYAFRNSGIQTVTFSETSSLSCIETNAFNDAKMLETIELPSSVSEIKKYAFNGSGLKNVSFGTDSLLETIGQYTFGGTQLVSIELPDSLKKIDYHAFEDISTLKTVVFGQGELDIYGYAFYQTGLEQVNIPENIRYIGEYCFAYCTELTSVDVSEENPYYSSDEGVLFNKNQTKLIQCPSGKVGVYNIPDDTEVLGFGAFEGSCLSEINISDRSKLVTIGYKAFYNCDRITDIYIPAQVQSVDYYAFAYCTKLSNITFNEESRLNGIYEGAFYGCEALKQFILPDSVAEIGEYAFYGCEELSEFLLGENSELMGIYDHAFEYTALIGFECPESVQEIGDYAFAHTNLLQFNLGKQLKSVGDCILYGCNEMNILKISCLQDTIVKVKELFAQQIPETFTNIIVSDTNRIPSYTFQDCNTVVKIEMQDDIFYVGEYAFAGCSKLEDISFMENVNSIEEGAFSGCMAIKTVNVKGLSTIPERLFAGCKQMDSIIGMENVGEIGYGAFQNCTSLSAISLEKVTSIDDYTFFECESLQAVTGTENIESYGMYSFAYCYNLTGISFACANNIGEYAFWCTDIRNAVFDENVNDEVKIGIAAFGGCDSLESAVLPANMTTIPYSCFSGCTSLENLKLPVFLKTIEAEAFTNCRKIRGIIFPESLKEIGKNAFYLDQDTETTTPVVWIPESVTKIEENAFSCAVILFESDTFPKNMNDSWDSHSEKVRAYLGCGKIYEENGLFYTIDENGAVAVYYAGTQDNLEVSSLGSNLVYKIGEYCFAHNNSIQSIIISDTVQEIGESAFEDCVNLSLVVLGESITDIHERLFYGCSSLEQVVLGKNIKSIGVEAFASSGLTYITLPDNVESLAEKAFMMCKKLETVHLPDGLRVIEKEAFKNCGLLSDINLDIQIERIGDDAFHSCLSLKAVELSKTLQYIGAGAFTECISFSSVEIPENITELSASVFERCSNIQEIYLPEKLEIIGVDAFRGCTKLNMLEVPDSTSVIGDYAFLNCTSLEHLYIPEKTTNIGQNAFKSCRSLFIDFYAAYLPDTLSQGWDEDIVGYRLGYMEDVKNGAEFSYILTTEGAEIYGYSGEEKEITIDTVDGYPVIKICNTTFQNNEMITSVYIGANVKSIEEASFSGCYALERVEFDTLSPITVFESEMFKSCINLKEIILPTNMTELSRECFNWCNSLVRVESGDKIVKIDDYCFNGCGSLEEIAVSGELAYIGMYSFCGCSQLSSIELPPVVDYLGENAFQGCDGLQWVEDGLIYVNTYLVGYEDKNATSYKVKDGTTMLSSSIFAGCNSLESIELPESVVNIPAWSFYETGITSLTIPRGLVRIDELALIGMDNLEELSISFRNEEGTALSLPYLFGNGSINGKKVPDSLHKLIITGSMDNVPRGAFDGGNLDMVIFEGSVREVACFSGFTDLSMVHLPQNLKVIGEYAFEGADISGLVIPDSVEEIGSSAFSDTTGLSKIVLPDSVTKLGNFVFSNCKTLTEICIPNSVTEMGIAILDGCDNMEKISMPFLKDGLESMFGQGYGTVIPTSLVSIEITGNQEVLPMSAFGGSKIEQVILPDSITTIGDNAFMNCTNLTEIKLPSNLKEIGARAFYGSGIENLILPESLETIGDQTFAYMYALKEIAIPQNISYICGYAFQGCSYLESVSVLGKTAISANAFIECDNLKILTLAFIGGNEEGDVQGRLIDTFGNASSSLEKVILLESCDSMSENAFFGISGIDIYCYLSDANEWPAGWNNGNTIHYLDTWNNLIFRVDGKVVSSSIYGIGDAIKLPARSLRIKRDDANYSYTFLGWDLNSDGVADQILAANLRNVVYADAVYAKTPLSDSLEVSLSSVYQDEDGIMTGNVASGKSGIQNVEVTLTSDVITTNAGKEVRIVTDLGAISFDGDATSAICANLGSEEIALNITSVNSSQISGLSESTGLYHLELVSGDEAMSFGSGNGGNVVVTIPYSLADTASPVVTYIDEDGSKNQINAIYDEEAQTVSFMTSHFSLYGISSTLADTCTLTFDTNGGDAIESIIRAKGRKVRLPEATKEGNLFENWLDSNGNTFKAGEMYELNGNMVLSAQWMEKTDISSLENKVSLSQDSFVYSGEEQKPEVLFENMLLDRDYTVSYSGNFVDVGVVTVTVEGIGAYKGQILLEYTIIEKELEETWFLLQLDEAGYCYDGVEKRPVVLVNGLEEGKDYSLVYESNISAGTAFVRINGIGNYAGRVELSFEIRAQSIEDREAEIQLSQTIFDYDKSEKRPDVSFGDLVLNEDYTVEYFDNIEIGNAQIAIAGIGNYTGTIYKEFQIICTHPESVADGAISATCIEAGYTGDKYCLTCNEKIEEGKIIPATGHSQEKEVRGAKAATCTEAGYTGNKYCLTCKEKVEEGEIIPATGHSQEKEVRDAKAATCTEAGYTGDKYCLTCGEKVEEGKIVPATGHSQEKEVRDAKAATCTEAGYTGDKYCLTCKEKVEEGEIIPASGHSQEKEVRDAKAATCEEEGYTGDKYCLNCNEKVEEGEVIPVAGHSQEKESRNAKAATCTETGYTGDFYCKVCGTLLLKGETITAMGHMWDSGQITIQPTTTNAGEKTYTCQRCKIIRKEAIKATEPIGLPKGTVIKDTKTNGIYMVSEDGTTVEYTKPANSKKSTVLIPDTVTYQGVTCNITSIAANAFKGNKYLKTVKIGNNVVSIGKNSFYNCKKLKSIILGNNVVSIGAKAFAKCTVLTKITIPSSVTSIGKQAFYDCKKLKSITIKTTKLTSKSVGAKAFKGTHSKPTVSVPKAMFSKYKKLLKAKGINSKAKYKKK